MRDHLAPVQRDHVEPCRPKSIRPPEPADTAAAMRPPAKSKYQGLSYPVLSRCQDPERSLASDPGRSAGLPPAEEPACCYGSRHRGSDKPSGRPARPASNSQEASPMATYRMVYGDDEQVVRETFENIDDLEREDGWVVLFRGPE